MLKIMIEADLNHAEVFIPEFYDYDKGYEKTDITWIPFAYGDTREEFTAKILDAVKAKLSRTS